MCTDVYDAVDALDGTTYDVVYVSLGALTWLPKIDEWAEQVAALVKPGGRFYLHDQHPVAWALADKELAIEHTYFEEHEPFVDKSGETYTGSDQRLANARTHEWNHSLGESSRHSYATACRSNGSPSTTGPCGRAAHGSCTTPVPKSGLFPRGGHACR